MTKEIALQWIAMEDAQFARIGVGGTTIEMKM